MAFDKVRTIKAVIARKEPVTRSEAIFFIAKIK